MNKILIDTETLKGLLAAHPEVEVELLRIAKEKIAEELKRKLPVTFAQDKADLIVKQIMDEVNKQMLDWRGLRLSDKTQDMLRNFVRDYIGAAIQETVQARAEEAVDKAVAAMKPRLEKRLEEFQEALTNGIDKFVAKTIEKQISERLNAMLSLAGAGSKITG